MQVTNTKIKSWLIALTVAFLLGLVPMWFVAYSRGSEVNRMRSSLTAATLRNQIAAAALYGRRGEYDKSRQSASEFFSGLRARLDTQNTISQEERGQLTKLAEQRDQIIALLARQDPASVDRLFELQHLVIQAIHQ
jgi:hypothetical protein